MCIKNSNKIFNLQELVFLKTCLRRPETKFAFKHSLLILFRMCPLDPRVTAVTRYKASVCHCCLMQTSALSVVRPMGYFEHKILHQVFPLISSARLAKCILRSLAKCILRSLAEALLNPQFATSLEAVNAVYKLSFSFMHNTAK